MRATTQHVVATFVTVGLLGAAGAAQERPKLVAAVRGPAKVEITKPSTKISGGDVVTTILLKNIESAPIAGLKVEENWYTPQGNPVGGDIYRHRRPIQPGEVVKVELRSPRPPKGSRNQYGFSHANGPIKQTIVPKLEAPKES